MRMRAAALWVPIAFAIAARGEEPARPPGDTELRWIDPSDQSYRSLRAGEGFRTHLFGRDVEVPPRDRRSTSAIDLGVGAWSPAPDRGQLLPVGSLYLWRRPDERRFLRATVGVIYDDVVAAHAIAGGPFEAVFAFENNTVPFDSVNWVDGERDKAQKLRKGFVRGAAGVGYRRQLVPGWRPLVFAERVDPQKPDNMLSISLTAEPKYLYFRKRNSSPLFVLPQDTFELDGRLALRWDALERNLLELAHEGFAVGLDATYGWRAHWENWGIGGMERAGRGRYPKQLQIYGVAASGLPGIASDRHRLIWSAHAGWGWNLDRFSEPRLGGGPGGNEFLSLARPLLPGAAISEFTPNHYAVALAEYRYELLFFTYVGLRGGVAWLDRDRLRVPGIHTENNVLWPVGFRLTTGFLFHTQLQVDYNYNFDLIRESEPRGGSELIVHISRSF